MSKSFTHKMATKTSWHRYGTKLRHCHRVYCSVVWCSAAEVRRAINTQRLAGTSGPSRRRLDQLRRHTGHVGTRQPQRVLTAWSLRTRRARAEVQTRGEMVIICQQSYAVAPPGGNGEASPLRVDVQKLCNMCVLSLSWNFFVSHDKYIARPSSKEPR